MQDLCTQILFQVFNHIWRKSDIFGDALLVPYCYCYEVFPTGLQEGFMEVISGLKSLKDFDWVAWGNRRNDDNEDSDAKAVSNMIRSAAGSYAGAYVLGVTDRHWDNITIKDDQTLLHIDFGYLLGDAPPIDAPRFSISPGMETVFKQMKIWEPFVETTVNAFLALRRASASILRAATLMFDKAGFKPDCTRSFLRGKQSLNFSENNEEAAGQYVRAQIEASSTDWKAKFKQFNHEIVDPGWFGLVQAGFLPAKGIMKLVDAWESKTTRRLAMKAKRSKEEPQACVNIDKA